MSKNYAEKRAHALAVANAATLTKVADAVKHSALEVAQEMQSRTTFVAFAIEGGGATLLLGDTVFRYAITADGCKLAVVVVSDNRSVQKDDAVDLAEVRDLASRRIKVYRPHADANDLDFENARVHILGLLLSAIDAEGGDRVVAQAIGNAREAELVRIENARQEKVRQEAAKKSADRIVTDIKSGKLLSDPFEMFDTSRAQRFGFVIDGNPVVLQTGSQETGSKKKVPSWVALCMFLPYEVEGLEVSTFVPLYRLFDENNFVNPRMASMANRLAELFSENLDKAKQLAYDLGVSEGSVRVVVAQPQPKEGATSDSHADVDDRGASNFFFLKSAEVPGEATVH